MFLPRGLLVLLVLVPGCGRSGSSLDALAPFTWIDSKAPFDPATDRFEGKPVAELLRVLREGSEDERWSAAIAMDHVHHGCVRHTMHSGRCGPGPDATRRAILAVSAGAMSPRGKIVVPALVQALGDESPMVRGAAARSLLMIGPESREAGPRLRELLKDEDPNVRGWSGRALYKVLGEIEGPLATHIDLLVHKDAGIRSMACYSLELMNQDARAAIPALEIARNDAVEEVRRQARQALAAIRA